MKIGIVNDMPLAVEALKRAIALEPSYAVVWVAGNGAEAIERCGALRPDVILMDLLMPVMDGVEATRRIMAQTPCAIVVVTGDVSGQTSRVFDAMGHGALDAVNTPALGQGDIRDAAAPLLRKIRNVGWLIGRYDAARVPAPAAAATRQSAAPSTRLVAIGASAGGPAALAELLRVLPADFPAAIVLVQHVDAHFAAGMATWFNEQTPLPVRLAMAGDVPLAGTVLLAGTDDHLHLRANGRLAYGSEPVESLYRPSIDVFFQCVATHWQGEAVGILLTGMGRDGAQGLKAMRQRGFLTLAQDQASSAVYGMPKAAAAIGAAVEIRSPAEIASRLLGLFPAARPPYPPGH
ncbi:chemotaxis response regulator protein-glutamate methylesterase [Variovorax ginsengisoli]|uniref:Protein-glutamate methylesterase/protein-glutamine glutaminase n=1 Tax=Variovorax ginsengisoli TaxID=363844 RepID=A0ABT9SDA8_9BURK|nr:chemotaxis response regulator protein-glutamate methylesterase [Variovorax ginsengisoli]MDP9902165.1 two-component system response regulator WspF [Variovorax ginsengisoli]